MKKYFFLALCLLCMKGLAQQEFYYPMYQFVEWPYEWNRYEMEKVVKENLIRHVVVYREIPAQGKKPASKTKKMELDFNESGALLSSVSYSNSGKPGPSWKIAYNGRDFSEKTYNPKGALQRTTNYRFDKDSNLICYENLKGSEEKLKLRLQTVYGEGKLMLERKLFKNHGRLDACWNYEYDGKKLLKTTVRNGKGKVSHVWNHDCLPEGTEAGKESRDTTTVCKKFETDSAGNLVHITRTVDINGTRIMQRSVYYPDTTLKAYYRYDKNGQLTNLFIPFNKYNPSSESVSYHKGKEVFRMVNQYKDEKRVQSTTTYHQKPGRTTKLYYDAQGCLVRSESWNDRDQSLDHTFWYEISTTL